jgi:hypothetical protein
LLADAFVNYANIKINEYISQPPTNEFVGLKE